MVICYCTLGTHHEFHHISVGIKHECGFCSYLNVHRTPIQETVRIGTHGQCCRLIYKRIFWFRFPNVCEDPNVEGGYWESPFIWDNPA